MPYVSVGKDYSAVCKILEWDESIEPIEIFSQGAKVYVRGTCLKINEWEELLAMHGAQLPDGREISVHKPKTVR